MNSFFDSKNRSFCKVAEKTLDYAVIQLNLHNFNA